jgi:hypothetical protein
MNPATEIDGERLAELLIEDAIVVVAGLLALIVAPLIIVWAA